MSQTNKDFSDIQVVISRFEELSKERDIYFHHDKEDGYYIKLSDKGLYSTRFEIAELEPTCHKDMISAMKCAVEWMEKSDEDFRLLLSKTPGC